MWRLLLARHGTYVFCQCHTWIESLFPYIEQEGVYSRINFSLWPSTEPNASTLNNLVISGLMCPSDPDAGLMDNFRWPFSFGNSYTSQTQTTGSPPCCFNPGPAGTRSLAESYAPCGGPLHTNTCPIPPMTPNINCIGVSGGFGYNDGSNDYGTPGMFAGGRIAYCFTDCTDGTSNTLLMGEVLPAYAPCMMYFAGASNIASTNPPPNYCRTTTCPKRIDASSPMSPSANPDYYCYSTCGGYNSMHPGGVNIAMADGSVRFVSEGIDYPLYQYLGNKADGQVVPNF